MPRRNALILLLLRLSITCAFTITELRVPDLLNPTLNHSIELSCDYNIDDVPFTTLNWFKGNRGFFTYHPDRQPPYRAFQLDGVGELNVKHCDLKSCGLVLSSLTEDATGFYRCDMTMDARKQYNGRTVAMVVQSDYQTQVEVTGLKASYATGDFLDVKCTTPRNGSTLVWYINGIRSVSATSTRASLRLAVGAGRLTGIDPEKITIQCVETRDEFPISARTVRARRRSAAELLAPVTTTTHATAAPAEETSPSRASRLAVALLIPLPLLFVTR